MPIKFEFINNLKLDSFRLYRISILILLMRSENMFIKITNYKVVENFRNGGVPI